jgi:AraC-like DNA-binding protein/ABC-type Fe3+-hydroxamate transport system substrate-binding protein
MKRKGVYTTSRHFVFLLRMVGFRRRTINRKLRLRSKDVYILYYVVRGRGSIRMRDETFYFAPQQLILIPPYTLASVSFHNEAVDYYVISFSHLSGGANDLAERIIWQGEEMSLLPAGKLLPHQSQHTFGMIQQLYENSCGQSDELLLQLQFQELLYALLQDAVRRPDPLPPQRSIDLTIDHMERYYHEKLDVKQLSEIAGLTLSSYSRLFKQVKGVSPTEYLTRVRIESAKQLLEQNRHKIKDVAASVGFRDEFYFSHVFHRTVGVSPTMYMKRSRMKVAVASCLQFPECLRSLGLEPVASVNCFRYPGMSEEEYAHVLHNRMEELQAAKPDLIICDRHHYRFMTEFKEFASQVVSLTEINWRTNYSKMAEILGLQNEMNERLYELDSRIAEVRRSLQSSMSGESVIVIQVTHLGIRLQGMVGHPLNELLYGELGLLPGKNMPLSAAFLELAPEWLPFLEADRLLIHMNHLRAGSEHVYARMRSTHAWSSIRAVQRNRVHMIPNWFRMSWSPEGQEDILDELLEFVEVPCSEQTL